MADEPPTPGKAPSARPPRWLEMACAAALAASVVLAAVGLAIPLGSLDVDTRVGFVNFVLRSDFTESGISYTGSAPDLGLKVGNEVTFLGGTGEFQERVGFLKGTAKERTNQITPWTAPQTRYAELNVTVMADTIPWWVVGVGVPCHVRVELVSWANVSELRVNSAYLEFHRKVGGEMLSKVVWQRSVSDRLERVGQVLTYSTELEASEDWGEFSLFGMVNVTMKDSLGQTATMVTGPYDPDPATLAPGQRITLWTIPTSQGAKVALAAVAMPATVAGVALCALAAAVAALGRWRKPLLLLAVAGTVLLLLGGVFFRIGVSELATVVGYPDDLTFSGGYWVVACAFVPAAAAVALLGYAARRWPLKPPEKVRKEEGP